MGAVGGRGVGPGTPLGRPNDALGSVRTTSRKSDRALEAPRSAKWRPTLPKRLQNVTPEASESGLEAEHRPKRRKCESDNYLLCFKHVDPREKPLFLELFPSQNRVKSRVGKKRAKTFKKKRKRPQNGIPRTPCGRPGGARSTPETSRGGPKSDVGRFRSDLRRSPLDPSLPNG